MHVACQAARDVVLDDMRDAAGGEGVEATGGAVGGYDDDWGGRGWWFGEEMFGGSFGEGGGEGSVGGVEVLEEVGETGSGFGGGGENEDRGRGLIGVVDSGLCAGRSD